MIWNLDPMHPAYFETRFRPSEPVSDWPAEFVILSAYATTGQAWTPQENEAADHRLEMELRERGGFLARVTGYSPASGHAEPSWASDVALEEARKIGERFRQDAIYHVRNDDLSVTRCTQQSPLVHVGSFRSRLDL
jgi:hypothetical protein